MRAQRVVEAGDDLAGRALWRVVTSLMPMRWTCGCLPASTRYHGCDGIQTSPSSARERVRSARRRRRRRRRSACTARAASARGCSVSASASAATRGYAVDRELEVEAAALRRASRIFVHAASAGSAAPAASAPCRNAGMYALKCANSVPQPTAPTTRRHRERRRPQQQRLDLLRQLARVRMYDDERTTTSATATTIVSARKCHRISAVRLPEPVHVEVVRAVDLARRRSRTSRAVAAFMRRR